MTDVSEGPKSEETKPLTVSQVAARVKKAIESDPFFGRVQVLGELSNFKRHSSGHIYFTMKDQDAAIDCVFFRNANSSLDFAPKEGMEVVVVGSVKTYPKRGSYQIYVSRMKRGGLGELYKLYEETKKKLIAEGLTDETRKRPLPEFPRRIGIVSSQDSAGLQDLLKVLTRRFPLAEVVLAPVNVEGAGSAPSIAEGLRLMAHKGRADVVIVGRGGGSIESLWGFNTELVARAIAAMPVPVISAVGHQTDVTIADLVADRRAATPTEAAELATPSVEDIASRLDDLYHSARRFLDRRLRALESRLSLIGRTLRSPETLLLLRAERTDRALERMSALSKGILHQAERGLDGIHRRLLARSTDRLLLMAGNRADTALSRMGNRITTRRIALEERVKVAGVRLEALNPTAILRRGYSVALFKGKAVKSADEVNSGDELVVRVSRGEFGAKVK